jgi:hypothetical protein
VEARARAPRWQLQWVGECVLGKGWRGGVLWLGDCLASGDSDDETDEFTLDAAAVVAE